MRAVLNLHRENLLWAHEYFPEENPFLLPVVNKPLIEYIFDFCSMCGMEHVLIIDPEYDARIEEFVGDGIKWNLKIRYLGENTGPDASEILRHHRTPEGGDDEIVLFNGLCFPLYDQNHLPDLKSIKTERGTIPPFGVCVLVEEDGKRRFDTLRGLPTFALNGLLAYYDLNFSVLHSGASKYVLPGYQVENGLYTGMNVMVTPGCCVTPPAALGDHVHLGIDVRLSNVIIGDNVIVDTRCMLQDAIVMGNAYLGADLEFRKMIILRKNVIDLETGLVVRLPDSQFAKELRLHRRKMTFIREFLGKILALVILIVLFPAYALFRLFLVKPSGKFAFYRIDSEKGMVRCEYTRFDHLIHNRWKRYFHALSLDRVPKLWQVLRGHMRLIGDTAYDADDPETKTLIRENYSAYKCGAFTLSELTWNDRNGTTHLIDDLYLEHNRGLRLDVQVIFRSFLERIFENGEL